MGEFTYDKLESNFISWNLTRGSVSLLEYWLLLVIPSCKTDPVRCGIILTILATSDKTCVVTSLNNLFTRFPKASNQLFFTNHAGTFSRNYVTRKFQVRFCALGYKRNYTGHSFRRGVVTSAKLAGLLADKIQLLGR